MIPYTAPEEFIQFRTLKGSRSFYKMRMEVFDNNKIESSLSSTINNFARISSAFFLESFKGRKRIINLLVENRSLFSDVRHRIINLLDYE